MLSSRSLRRLFAGSLVVGGVFLLTARGQQPEDQLSNSAELGPLHKKIYLRSRQLIKGDEEATEKDRETIDVLAKWFAYRPTWIGFKDNPANLNKSVVAEFETFVNETSSNINAAKKQKFIAMLGKPLADRFRELFKRSFSGYSLAIVNSAQMLPTAARLKQEEVGDLLAEIIADPKQHEAVKVFALKGLVEFFPAKVVNDDELIVDAGKKDKPITTRKDRDAKRIQGLVDFIERKWPGDMEADVVRYLRREAIAALGQAGVPAVTALKKAKKVEGPVAYGLMKVLVPGAGGLTPAPSTSEKIEAIVGLCKMKLSPPIDGFDPTPANALIAHALLDVFNDYRADWNNIRGGRIPRVAWKFQAERLKQGLQEWVANTKDTPGHKDAIRIEAEAKALLSAMQAKGFGQVDVQLFGPLATKDLRPKAKSGPVYTKHSGYDLVIDFTENAAEAVQAEAAPEK